MNRVDTIVPKDTNLMDVLAQMGENTRNAWIFLHKSVVKTLDEKANAKSFTSNEFSWDKTPEHPRRMIKIEGEFPWSTWEAVSQIDAEDIAFKSKSEDPDKLFFFKIEE